MAQADDLDLLLFIVNCDQQEVTADNELAYFKRNVGVFLGLSGTPWVVLQRIYRVPDLFDPALERSRALGPPRQCIVPDLQLQPEPSWLTRPCSGSPIEFQT